jgi:hypothetical protein
MVKIPKSLKSLEVDIDSLNIDPDNARRRDDEAIEQLMSSLTRFGQRRPLVVRKDGMMVEAGNGRLEAARRLGWKKIAAVVTEDDAATAAAYALADNKTADMGTWDSATLANQLDDLFEKGPSAILGIGFNDDDLTRLLNDASDVSILDMSAPQAVYADGTTDEDHEPASTDYDGSSEPDAPESNVRMLQLFYDEEQHDRFMGAVIALSAVYETANTTETTLTAVLEEAAK